jgi:hypothetical protein
VELSPGRQKALFVVIVAVLAVIGYVLVVPALHSRGAAAKPTATATAAPGTPATTVPAAAPVATQVPAGNVNIYNWLPFTQQDLAAAAAVAMRFGVDYDTFAYTESAASYVGRMTGLITGQMAATLQNGYTTPGVAALRTGQKQISTATASIVSLRAFGPSSLVFIVDVTQRLAGSRGTTNGSTRYAVTLTGSGGNWQVSDIELASVGNT